MSYDDRKMIACHEIALECAKREVFLKKQLGTVLESFDPEEQMLIVYDDIYTNLSEDYDAILEKRTQLVIERSHR